MKRQIQIDGAIAIVPLTDGYVAVIDAADVHLVEGRLWHANPWPRTTYARASVRAEDGRFKKVRMHNLLTGWGRVDHIDGDGLNNRRENLRPATSSQNNRNAKRRSDNTSGFKGVTWRRRERKWAAQIRVDGKNMYLGHFDSPEAAHAAYCKASAELHGEFGRTA